MASAASEPADPLACEVCFRGFSSNHMSKKAPRLLLCGHTFCTSCLKNLVMDGSVRCPMCRQSTPIEVARYLKLNFALIDLLSMMDSNSVSCDACERQPASIWCRNCEVSLCSDCNESEHSTKLSKKHRRTALEEKPVICYCTAHKKEAEIFCLDCSELICFFCRDRDLGSHGSHKIDFINNVVDTQRKKLETTSQGLEKMLDDLGGVTKEVNEAKKSLAKRAQTNKDHLNSDIAAIVAAFKTRSKQLLASLEDETAQQQKLLTSQHEQLSETIASLNVLNTEISRAMGRTGAPLLKAVQEIATKFETAAKTATDVSKSPDLPDIRYYLDKKQIIQNAKGCGFAGAIHQPELQNLKAHSNVLDLLWTSKKSPRFSGYVVQHKCEDMTRVVDSKEDEWVSSKQLVDEKYTISNLKHGTSYLCRVAAVDRDGLQGPWSEIKRTSTKKGTTLEFEKIGDDHGVFYRLGTDEGKSIWKYQFPSWVSFKYCCSGGSSTGSCFDMFDRILYSKTFENGYGCSHGPWIQIQLKKHNLKIKKYVICQEQDHFMRNWVLEGSRDGTRWTVIKRHCDDTTLDAKNKGAAWDVSCDEYYRHFQVRGTGHAHSGESNWDISQLEFYGDMMLQVP